MSISDVAQRAGVSRATVSRVINQRKGVSRDIVDAVRRAAAALNYEPPPLNRRPGRRVARPSSRQTEFIAVILTDDLYQHTPGVFAAHLSGIEREAAEHGLGVLVAQVAEARFPAIVAEPGIAGLILMGSSVDAAVQQSLDRFTCVWLSSHQDQSGDLVLAGNQEISRIAVNYLLERGHRRLGYLSVMSKYPAYPARAEAFTFLAQSAGASAVRFMDTDEPGAFRAGDLKEIRRRVEAQVEKLAAMRFTERPTGLFVPNDMMTAMCYPSLRAKGIIAGKDIELISCNNETSYLLGLDPRPATIDIGAETIGRRSVEQLIRRIKHPGELRQVQIAVTPELVRPDTSANPFGA